MTYIHIGGFTYGGCVKLSLKGHLENRGAIAQPGISAWWCKVDQYPSRSPAICSNHAFYAEAWRAGSPLHLAKEAVREKLHLFSMGSEPFKSQNIALCIGAGNTVCG